jgi:zeaxanthin glucosyltransferase
VGSVAKEYAALAMLHGEDVIKYSAHEIHPKRCQVALEQLPEKLVETGVEALVIDTVYFFVELVPISMGMPYVHIWNVLHVDGSGATPPCFFSWPHETTPMVVPGTWRG